MQEPGICVVFLGVGVLCTFSVLGVLSELGVKSMFACLASSVSGVRNVQSTKGW